MYVQNLLRGRVRKWNYVCHSVRACFCLSRLLRDYHAIAAVKCSADDNRVCRSSVLGIVCCSGMSAMMCCSSMSAMVCCSSMSTMLSWSGIRLRFSEFKNRDFHDNGRQTRHRQAFSRRRVKYAPNAHSLLVFWWVQRTLQI